MSRVQEDPTIYKTYNGGMYVKNTISRTYKSENYVKFSFKNSCVLNF